MFCASAAALYISFGSWSMRLDPAVDVRRAAAAVVADADTITRHHGGHFGAEFFAGVLDAAEFARRRS